MSRSFSHVDGAFFHLSFSQGAGIFLELASAGYGHKRDQRSRTDPGAVPGGSTTSASGGCVSDGADPESTYVERVWLCLGMIPPSSGQEHSCQHQRRSERSAPRGLTLTRSGNRSELLSSSIVRRGPRGAWQQNPRIQPPPCSLTVAMSDPRVDLEPAAGVPCAGVDGSSPHLRYGRETETAKARRDR